ncbi:hypothetical protein D5H78_13280 [Vallicoccus soli]|uniref:DUF2273 domain-containing protein n=1 Tax=Vallicoccus soli TaxID=2339232 RepID=A0A3A3YTY4_9ACTN|nr:hypothetical protein D5H78_13280 [Vallicoccus soli]
MTLAGLATGLVLGLAWAVDGFSGLFVTAVLGALGVVAGKVLAGQLDLTPYLGGAGRPRR